MKLNQNQLERAVDIAFETGKLLKVSGFSGEIDAKALISDQLYGQLDSNEQLAIFGKLLQDKIITYGNPYIRATTEFRDGRRVYTI